MVITGQDVCQKDCLGKIVACCGFGLREKDWIHGKHTGGNKLPDHCTNESRQTIMIVNEKDALASVLNQALPLDFVLVIVLVFNPQPEPTTRTVFPEPATRNCYFSRYAIPGLQRISSYFSLISPSDSDPPKNKIPPFLRRAVNAFNTWLLTCGEK